MIPRISIVCPTRNSPNLLDRLFNSLIHQTCSDFEFILVDTSPDDRTQERWFRDFAPHIGHRFRYAHLHLPTPDMAGSFEYAFDQARGDWICAMTSKAMWRADSVENFHRILDHHPNLPAFAFKSLYFDLDIHACPSGDFRDMSVVGFGSAWDRSDPARRASRDLFLESMRLLDLRGWDGQVVPHLEMPMPCHAIYSRALLHRVRDRFGTLVAGKYAADARMAYRVMDLEEDVFVFPQFEPKVSSIHTSVAPAGMQLRSWSYLLDLFSSLKQAVKEEISRSPFGYMPLFSVLNYWEIFSAIHEARGQLSVDVAFPAENVQRTLLGEINGLQNIDEGLRRNICKRVEDVCGRLDDGVLCSWLVDRAV